MKLLYTALIWGLIQLLMSQTLATTELISANDKLLLYYENNLELFAKEFSDKAKAISEKILLDSIIQKAKTPLIKEFKNNLTKYLNNYDLYKHFDLNNELLIQFITTTMQYYQQEPTTNKDFQYIIKLLRKLRYDELCNEYEMKFQKFIKEKFLQKFEELKQELLNDQSKQSRALLSWYNDLQECRNYKCYYNLFQKFTSVIMSPVNHFLTYIRNKLENFFIIYSNHAYSISKAILTDPAVGQLSPAFREQFVKDINEFLSSCENNHDIRKLYNLLQLFRINILEKYFHNKDIKMMYQIVLKNLFNNHNLSEFLSDYEWKFNMFIDTDLLQKFQELKASLDEEEFRQERPFIERFEYVFSMTNQTQKVEQLEMVYIWV
ncbi:hypothetical protein FF38_12669 [Lucilia cuprina]|uniref:Uncharacterized protein n=1 Tax=Lucilia cuprina TaxID=7375 RepID=A0A0L0C463_LUCCU|nr:hypothetical protein CVS40_7835 [Lucilia cuprina]KNC27148.1 hypothetical protein FF38_12669 [Lucilia cuprina]